MLSILNLPNSLTVVRIVLIPVFVSAILYDKRDIALYVFALAALTDLFDGLLARARKQKTKLGAVLDPLADKFMLVTSFVLFSYKGWIPVWLTVTVISRDIIVMSGWITIFITHALITVPSLLGKVSVASEYLLVSYVLLNVNYGYLPEIKDPVVFLTAFLASLSGLHYMAKGLKIASEK